MKTIILLSRSGVCRILEINNSFILKSLLLGTETIIIIKKKKLKFGGINRKGSDPIANTIYIEKRFDAYESLRFFVQFVDDQTFKRIFSQILF